MSDDAYSLDRRTVRQSFSKAAGNYEHFAALQAEVRQRLFERLPLFKLNPAVVLDLGCGTALSSSALHQHYPQAHVIAMDAAWGMLQNARPVRRWFGNDSFDRLCADAHRLPFKSSSIDLVFSNLMLQWCDPPDSVFAEVRRVLKPDGVFLFSTFGPDTLVELRNAWRSVDQHTHVNRFIDMHDVGDAMLRAGLAEPVLDVERFTLTYADVITLMRELKGIGAHNVTSGRRQGLTSRTALDQVIRNYEQHRRDGELPASYEVIYGQAWGNAASSSVAAAGGEVHIPIERIGRRRS